VLPDRNVCEAHFCGTRRSDGKFTLRRQTIAKKQRATIKRVKELLFKRINLNVHVQGQWLASVVRGFYHY